jgi:predicted histone-like DNA-binding protein
MSTITIDWYENPNGAEADGKKKLHPRLVDNGTMSTREIIRHISQSSTLAEGEMKAALAELSEYVGYALSRGKRVHLDGIGYLAPVIEATEEVTADTKRRGEKVRLKGISFKADKELMSRFDSMHFRQSARAMHSSKLSDAEIDRRLAAYFAEHPFMTRGDFQALCDLTESTAARLLRRLREAGKLRNVGRFNQPIYVPGEGATSA